MPSTPKPDSTPTIGSPIALIRRATAPLLTLALTIALGCAGRRRRVPHRVIVLPGASSAEGIAARPRRHVLRRRPVPR